MTLAEIEHGKKRVGQPRLNWFKVTLQDLWKEVQQNHALSSIRFASALNLNKKDHVDAIKAYAVERSGLGIIDTEEEEEAFDELIREHDEETKRLMAAMEGEES